MGRKLQREQRRGKRPRSIEPLEDRRVMAADFFGGAVTSYGARDAGSHAELPALVNHVQSPADFWIDSSAGRGIDALVGDVQQTLASAHNGSGVTQARNDYGFIGTGQTVAVIDSGIAWDHFALGGGFGANYRVVGGWDFTENDATPYDDGPEGGHGTHVAGIVGANPTGNADDGVAPGVDLVSLRVFDDLGQGYFTWVESALQWVIQNRNAFENPITAINLSLGTTWNSTSVPAWANLENEFAQLESLGIFITVSAGNSFTSYNTPGLSYPAASPYVVPVMSVDDSGSLSSFSQRHWSAIAAPGRMIRSTVPDYVGNQNGVNDDFGNMSGTSMAAPYVAGASVLVREAMQFVGYTNITQDLIFNHMMSTATSIWDAATSQWYKKLNVSNALDALMPVDEYGSTAGTAHSLGAVTDGQAIVGLIGKLSDADYFSFTAATTGTVTFTASTTHGLAPVWTGSGGVVSGSRGETFTFEVVAGQTYTFGLSTSAGIGYYTLSADVETNFTYTDLGTVTQAELNSVSNSGDQWYRIAAGRNGYITAQAWFAAAGGNVELALYDGNMQLVAGGAATSSGSRVDTLVGAGTELFLRVRGNNADIDFQLTNLVTFDGTTVTIEGTSGTDNFNFTAGAQHHTVAVNGVTYTFVAGSVSQFKFIGREGYDRITMTGTAGNETATLRTREATFAGAGFSVRAVSFENVTVHGGGGFDVANLYDSVGDDVYTARPEFVKMQGASYVNTAHGFAQTTARATGGGFDEANLYDSAGDDTLTAYPEWVVLQGSGFYSSVRRFEQVVARATGGGFDKADIYDSAGDDVYTAYPEWVHMRGTGFYNSLRRFEQTTARAIAGGYDRAEMYDSAGDDTYTTYPDWVIMKGTGYYNSARRFEQTIARATAGGNDRAELYDSIGDDVYTAWAKRSVLEGSGYKHDLRGFRNTIVRANAGGNDRAVLYDSAGDDRVLANSLGVVLTSNGFDYKLRGFESVSAQLVNGGNDTVDLGAFDYVFELAGR